MPASPTLDPGAADARVRKLSAASARRVIEPDAELPGHLGDGQLLPDELLSIADLDLDLTPEQKRTLGREEVASVLAAGVAFEAVLEAGFAVEIATRRDLDDPRVVFLLHEIGEETRHQRLFLRLLADIGPASHNPLDRWLLRQIEKVGIHFIVGLPALLYTLVLAGEEIPDLMQKLVAEHPDSDPFLREVNLYHRQEEARHLSYARAVLPEIWADAGPIQRYAVKRVAPLIVRQMFEQLIHPGVYATVGLPTWQTWKAAVRSPSRVAIRHEATRPVLRALIDAGALRPGRINRRWRSVCGVDRDGEPVGA